jgi:hypothetical protein
MYLYRCDQGRPVPPLPRQGRPGLRRGGRRGEGSVAAAFELWRNGFAEALRRGQAEGSVRREIDAKKVAGFVVAAIEGSYGLAKSAQSAPMLLSNLELLSDYLGTLRPAPGRRAAPGGRRPKRGV